MAKIKFLWAKFPIYFFKRMNSCITQATLRVLKIGIYRKGMTLGFSQPCPEFFQGGATIPQRSPREKSFMVDSLKN